MTQEEKIILAKHSKLVYCDADQCLWWEGIGFRKMIGGRFIEHFEEDFYKGICTRPEIGIRHKIVDMTTVKATRALCMSFSNKKISGHLDFSRFPQGGNIPDPITEV